MMDDAELVRQLRNMYEYEPLGHDGWKAAARIEALIAERDAARDAALEVELAFENVDAQVSDGGEFTERAWEQLAAAIRALKGKSHE